AGNFGATRRNVENYTSHFSSRGRQLSPSPQTSGFLRDRAAETTPPSRFVRVRPTASSASAPAAPAGVVAGARIAHDRFGLGTVVKLEGTGLDAKATVRFDNAGEKTLLLRFAKFKVIS
ncbi:MAG: ATP-dependent DNA helicase, partial [Bacteroidaceae bacterium]|nr:ATP-dependent DNA helicase [Bacteroidaceae bacterium]